MNITSYIVFLQLLLGSISLPSFGGAGGGLGFNGGDDYLVISVMGDSCVTLAPIDFEPFSAFKTMPQGTELLDNSMATLKVTGNVAKLVMVEF